MADDRRLILLVDDLRIFLKIEQDLLEENGCEVITAFSALEALEKTREYMPDLVLLDLYMPDMDGAECCRLIKRDPDLKKVKVVIITSKSIAKDRMRCFDAGCDGFISKISTHTQILVEIERALSHKGSRPSVIRDTLDVSFHEPAGPRCSGVGLDLGIDRMFVATDKRVERHRILQLEFGIPGFERRVRLKGEVIGVAKPSSEVSLVRGFHVRFVDPGASTLDLISEYLQEEKREAASWRPT